MVGKGEARADCRRELRAIVAGAKQPDRRQRYILRHGMDGVERVTFRKPAALKQQQFLEAIEEIVATRSLLATPQYIRGHRIGARRASNAEIDTAGKESFQHLEA